MRSNPNTDYELFTRHIYEVLVNGSSIRPTYVKHNVKLKGLSDLEHQIDVYFEYEDDLGKKRCVIECKNYSSLVPLGKVRDFFGVIHDLGNDVVGIMVSKEGFQSGAQKYAKKYGIKLFKLNKVSDDEVIAAIESHNRVDVIHHLFLVDEEYAGSHDIRTDSIRRNYSLFQPRKSDYWLTSPYVPLSTLDDYIYDSSGHIVSSIDELDNNTPFKQHQDYFIGFKDGWVKTKSWGMVKINGVKIESEVTEHETTINLQANGFVEALIKNVLSNEARYVTKL